MKRRISYTLCLLFALMSISSCNTMDELLAEKQNTATLTVKIAQQNPTTVTRAISDAIDNINVLVFDAQGHLIGSAYASSSPTSVSVPVRVSSGCTICAIANTGSSTYFDGISTLTELKTMVTPSITSATALASKSNEILYGETPDVTLSSGTNTQSVLLKRLYSKYTFTITPNSDITITSYQLCNVPNECYIVSGNAANPTTGFSVLNYDAVTTSATAGSAVTVGPLYIYENLAGTKSASSTAELRIKDNAPSGASYLLINAANSSWKSIYKVYLGGVTNVTTPVIDYTDFNIYRNFDYNCNIAIAGSGQNDARVTYAKLAVVGQYLFADGTWGDSGSNTSSKIGYVFKTTGSTTYPHGYAVALTDASTSCPSTNVSGAVANYNYSVPYSNVIGSSGWYLPSKDDLLLIGQVMGSLVSTYNIMINTWYWSSSWDSDNNALFVVEYASDGSTTVSYNVSNNFYVRTIIQF